MYRYSRGQQNDGTAAVYLTAVVLIVSRTRYQAMVRLLFVVHISVC